MNTVITVNLNGNAYQLDQQGFEALRAYLDSAEARLAGNPDKAEILSDIEQAIADKCRRYLNPHKSVVAAAELDRILAEMGPVESEAGGTAPDIEGQRKAADDPQSRTDAPRRLYQIREGAMISGVCNGLAAYFQVDVTIVRIVFVALTILTGSLWILAYILMMFIIPDATTSEERAAAHGQPFNAQQLVDGAKERYAEFRQQSARWQEGWRRGRQLRRERRAAAAERAFWRGERAHEDVGYATRVLAGFMVPVFTLIGAALFVVVVIAIVSLFRTGGIFDWALPHEVPVWGAILILVIIYQAVHMPLRAASRASYEATAGRRHGWLAAADGVLWLGFAALLFWLAYLFMPEVRSLFESMPFDWRHRLDAWYAL
jgi:phage shock protein PspC (stress-responsive transcriptional regulator)